MKKKVNAGKSIADLIKTVKGTKELKRQKKSSRKGDMGDDSSLDELRNLRKLQQQALETEMENAETVTQRAISHVKGLQKAYELEEEYKAAKTGIRSKAGKIAKAFGLKDDRAAAALDQIFGKKVSK